MRRAPRAKTLFASPGVSSLGVFGRILDVDDVGATPLARTCRYGEFRPRRRSDHKQGELLVRLADASLNDPPIARMVLGRRTATRVERLTNAGFALGRGATNIAYANGAAEAEEVSLALAELRGRLRPRASEGGARAGCDGGRR